MRRAWKRYGYDGQPPTVSAAEIIRSSKDRELGSPVRTADDLNKMIRQWQRFNEVKRPGSTKPHALETGEVVPEYFVQERKRWVRAENRKRKKVVEELYPSGLFDTTTDTSPLYDLAMKAAGKNILPVSYNEDFENPMYDDVTALNFVYEQGSPNMTSFQNYTIRGQEYKGRRQQVIDFWNLMKEKYLE